MLKQTLQKGLKTRTFAQHLVVYDETDSTNTRAKETLKIEILPEGAVFIAKKQTAGRGTGGNTWESSTPESLLFSLVLQTPLRQQPLSFLPAIALVRTLSHVAGIEAHLKWPNDVLIGKRKLAGILCEAVKQPDLTLAWVVGVGVNINQAKFPNSIQDVAVSMRQITGNTYCVEDIFQAYMLEMESLYHSTTDLTQEWLNCTKMVGKSIITTKNAQQRTVTVVGLSQEGYLIVECSKGMRETWMSSTYLDIGTNY